MAYTKPIPLAQSGILDRPIDVQARRVLPRPGSETGTFRISAHFHRVDRHLSGARDATAIRERNIYRV